MTPELQNGVMIISSQLSISQLPFAFLTFFDRKQQDCTPHTVRDVWFDSCLERGYAISTWRDSFIAWLKDAGFIKE